VIPQTKKVEKNLLKGKYM